MSIIKRILRCFFGRGRDRCWPADIPGLTVEQIEMSRERGINFVARHPAFAMMADDIAKMFEEDGGINYVEYTLWSKRYGPMSVCVQRLEGETPAMQNMRLRKRIADLEGGAGK